jgi:hypothetical protein
MLRSRRYIVDRQVSLSTSSDQLNSTPPADHFIRVNDCGRLVPSNNQISRLNVTKVIAISGANLAYRQAAIAVTTRPTVRNKRTITRSVDVIIVYEGAEL